MSREQEALDAFLSASMDKKMDGEEMVKAMKSRIPKNPRKPRDVYRDPSCVGAFMRAKP